MHVLPLLSCPSAYMQDNIMVLFTFAFQLLLLLCAAVQAF